MISADSCEKSILAGSVWGDVGDVPGVGLPMNAGWVAVFEFP